MVREGAETFLWSFTIVSASCLVGSGSAIYIPPNLDLKYLTDSTINRITNAIHQHHHQHHHHNHHHRRSNISRVPHSWRTFKNDQEISHYLKLFNKKILIWTCKNVVERDWNGPRTPPHLDLYCNVIGHIGSVTWFHGHRPIFSKNSVARIHNHLDRKKRYTQVISPHVLKSGQHLYKQWTDVRLRIHNVTSKDSGLYTFRVTSKSKKKSDSQQLFVYVAKKEDDGPKKHRKKKSSKVHNITKRKTDLKGKIED